MSWREEATRIDDREQDTESWRSKAIPSSGDQVQQIRESPEQELALGMARDALGQAPFPTIRGGTLATGASLLSKVARVSGLLSGAIGQKRAAKIREEQADYWNRYSNALVQVAGERAEEPGNIIPPIVKRGAAGALRSSSTAVIAGPLGMYGMALGGALDEANIARTEGKDAGLKGKELNSYVARQGAIEGVITGVMNKVGLGGMEKIIGGRAAIKNGIRQTLKQGMTIKGAARGAVKDFTSELAEEITIETLQLLNDKYSDVSEEDITLKSLAQVAAETTSQVVWTMGGVSAFTVPAQISEGKRARAEKEIVDSAESGKAPSRKQWSKKWGFPVDKIKSAEDRLQAVQELAGEIQAQREAPGEQVTPEAPGAAVTASETGGLITPEMPAIERLKQEATESIPRKKGFLKEEAGARPVAGGRLGQRERTDIIASKTEVDMSVGISKVDTRLEAARGIKRPGLFEKIKEGIATSWHYATRPQANIPKRDPFFATGNEIFRLLKAVPRSSRDEAIRVTRAVIDPMGPKQLELFGRYIQISNQLAALDNGQPLRHGFSNREEVEAYKSKLNELVNATPEVKKAIESRTEAVRDVVGAAVAHNLLPETALQNAENYYHQQVMMYHAARKTTGTRSTLSRAKKSFQRRRVSGPEALDVEYDYNTDYIESEVSWMSDALGKIRGEQLLDKLISTFGRTQEFKAKAKAGNVSLSKVVRDDESVASWQPMPGNVFYRAFSVPEKIAEQLQSGALESFDLTKDELRDVVAIGSNRESVVLPREIVDELESAKSPSEAHWIDKLNQSAIKAWKAWSTVGPKRIFSYSVRNITGDISPVIAVDPGILKEVTATVSDLRGLYKVTKPLSEVQRASRDLGVVSSGFFASEVSNVGNLSTFNYLDTLGKQTTRALTRPDLAYLETVGPINNFREDLLRHSAFRYYRNKLNNNEEINFGASQDLVVKQLQKDMGNDVAAAHLSRNLIGDYGNMSVAGEWLRRHLIPFWSFQEINLRRWPQITINAIKAGKGKGRLATVYTAIATMRLAQGYAALYTWNNVIAPFIWGFDDDDELSSYDRANPHIMLGRTSDGSIRVFRNVGAIGDFFEWFGLNEAISLMDKYKAGQVEESDIIREMLKSPIEKMVGGLRPDIKGGFEVLSGQSFFPSPFEPRSVERGEAVANIAGLSDEYKWVKGMMLGKGDSARNNYWLRMFVGVVDPKKSALGEIYDLRRRFLDSKGARGKGVFPVSEYKIARDAVTNEDYNSFVKWKVAFQERHPKNYIRKFKSFLGSLDPIASRLSNADESEFVNVYLNGEQRVKLKAARDYADEMRTTLLVWWRAAERSGDKLVK